jgi:hypothetical protein
LAVRGDVTGQEPLELALPYNVACRVKQGREMPSESCRYIKRIIETLTKQYFADETAIDQERLLPFHLSDQHRHETHALLALRAIRRIEEDGLILSRLGPAARGR